MGDRQKGSVSRQPSRSDDKAKVYARRFYEKHRERVLAEQRAKYAALSEDERREIRRRKSEAAKLKGTPRAYRERNKEALKAKLAIWRANNLPRILWNSARHRAKRFGHLFAIKPTDIVVPEFCPVFGTLLERARWGKPGPNSPTLDRIDNAKGYVPGNIAVISKYANDLKSCGTAWEHYRIAQWMQAGSK
jgi:hypothetical protein